MKRIIFTLLTLSAMQVQAQLQMITVDFEDAALAP